MKKSIIGFGITILVGGVFTVILVLLDVQGYFVKWTRLPMPSSQPSEIITGDFANLIIRTEDGNLFRCQYPFQNGCWNPTDPSEIPELEIGDKSCLTPMDEINPPFFPFAIKQKLQLEHCFVEGNSFKTYAISDKGELWVWGPHSTGIEEIFYVLLGWIGTFLLAVIVAVVIYIYIKEERRKQDTKVTIYSIK